MLDKVLVLSRCSKTAFAAAPLTRIRRDRRAFDVTGLCDGDGDLFVGDQILDIKLGVSIDDLCPASITINSLDLGQLVNDDLPQHTLVRENVFKLGDVFDDLCVFVEDLLPFKGRQAA